MTLTLLIRRAGRPSESHAIRSYVSATTAMGIGCGWVERGGVGAFVAFWNRRRLWRETRDRPGGGPQAGQ